MSDYNFLMESQLSPEQFAVLSLISRVAAEQGLNLYLVGGAVRDLTYGQQVVHDLDFAVEGLPQKILRQIPHVNPAQTARGVRGTVTDAPLAIEREDFDTRLTAAELRFSNGVRAALAMCREESYPRPGQPPEVRAAMVFEDLKRRDFALNAMAVSLHPNSRGLLLDPTNGAGDIEHREIRALHSRSFLEDPSRIYRLLRLGIRLDFKPDERTQRWIDTAIEDGAWEHLDPAQQARELRAILREDQPGRVLKVLAERKLLVGLDKKLATTRIPYDRFARIRSVLQSVPGADAFLLNFHCLVQKLGGEHTARLAKKIIGDDRFIKLALSLERDARKLERLLGSAKANLPSQTYALLSTQPAPLLLFLLANSTRAKVQNRIKNYLFKYPQIRASLPRNELQSLGMKPGPEFQQILEQIFALQLDGKIKSHQHLMKELRALAGIKEPPPEPPPAHPPKKTKGAALAPPPQPSKKGKETTAAPPRGGSGKPRAKAAIAKPSAKQASARTEPVPKTPRPASKHSRPVAKATGKSKKT